MSAAHDTHFFLFQRKRLLSHPDLPRLPAFQNNSRPQQLNRVLTPSKPLPRARAQRERQSPRRGGRCRREPRLQRSLDGAGPRGAGRERGPALPLALAWPGGGPGGGPREQLAHGPTGPRSQGPLRAGAERGWERRRGRECLGIGNVLLARCLAADGGWGRRGGLAAAFSCGPRLLTGKRSGREPSAPRPLSLKVCGILEPSKPDRTLKFADLSLRGLSARCRL